VHPGSGEEARNGATPRVGGPGLLPDAGAESLALARKLAGILFAIWRDGTAYDVSELQSGRMKKAAYE
jgi:hypothetical protein